MARLCLSSATCDPSQFGTPSREIEGTTCSPHRSRAASAPPVARRMLTSLHVPGLTCRLVVGQTVGGSTAERSAVAFGSVVVASGTCRGRVWERLFLRSPYKPSNPVCQPYAVPTPSDGAAPRRGQPGCISIKLPPVIRDLLVIEISNASDKGTMSLPARPVDCLALRLEGLQHMVRVILALHSPVAFPKEGGIRLQLQQINRRKQDGQGTSSQADASRRGDGRAHLDCLGRG